MNTSQTHILSPAKREQQLVSPQGQLRVLSACRPEFLHTLTLEAGLGRFARYRSIISGVETLERVAALSDANVTVALSPAGQVVGYVECSYPDAIEGWKENTDGLCYELGAIEVSRNWRRYGVARAMVSLITEDPFLDGKIFFLTGYSWHWDTDQTGLSTYAYRNLLVRLFRPFGFRVYLTNNPEIRMSSANVLMARVGARVPPQHLERFHHMLFLFEQ